jgi:hypothetical protein
LRRDIERKKSARERVRRGERGEGEGVRDRNLKMTKEVMIKKKMYKLESSQFTFNTYYY